MVVVSVVEKSRGFFLVSKMQGVS